MRTVILETELISARSKLNSSVNNEQLFSHLSENNVHILLVLITLTSFCDYIAHYEASYIKNRIGGLGAKKAVCICKNAWRSQINAECGNV